MNALLIIDVQNDFLPGGTLAVPKGDSIIPVINLLQPHFDVVVATQDWHPQNHSSFASNHANKKAFETLLLNQVPQTLWPDHCVQNTNGADFPSHLNTKKIAAIFRKGMHPEVDSYSAFYDNQKTRKTGLTGYLKELNIDTLYFCGVAADICVYHSIQDAITEGFKSALILDATQALDATVFAHQQNLLTKQGVTLITSSQII